MRKPTNSELLEALKFANTMGGEKMINPKGPMGVAETIFYCVAKEIFGKSELNTKAEDADHSLKIEDEMKIIRNITMTNGDVISNAVPAIDAPELPGFIGFETLVDVGPEDRPNVNLSKAVKYINVDCIAEILVDGED